jgi:hypothetical protein
VSLDGGFARFGRIDRSHLGLTNLLRSDDMNGTSLGANYCRPRICAREGWVFRGLNPSMITYWWRGSPETEDDRWSPGNRAQGTRRPDFHNSNQNNMLRLS